MASSATNWKPVKSSVKGTKRGNKKPKPPYWIDDNGKFHRGYPISAIQYRRIANPHKGQWRRA